MGGMTFVLYMDNGPSGSRGKTATSHVIWETGLVVGSVIIHYLHLEAMVAKVTLQKQRCATNIPAKQVESTSQSLLMKRCTCPSTKCKHLINGENLRRKSSVI